MKILAVCTSANVYGAETVVLNLLEGSQQAGHQIHALTSVWTDGQFRTELKSRSISFDELPMGWISKSIRWPYPWWTTKTVVRLPYLWWRFRKIRKLMQPDLILLSSIHQVILLWFVLGKTPVAMVTQFCPNKGDTKAERFWRFIARKVTHWTACSGYIKQRLESLGVPSSQISVVHSATLVGLPKIKSEGDRNSRSEPVLGIIGQVGSWKGHEDLIRAAGILRSQGYQFSIQIYGDGNAIFKEFLRSLAAELGLIDQIEWKGYVREKAEIFQAIDICVVPSRFDDPYPTVVMEAASFGIPVVGTTRGGLPELVPDGETGFLVPAEDPASLAERLAQLIQSPELRHQQGLAALERAGTVFQRSRMIADFTRVVSTLSR